MLTGLTVLDLSRVLAGPYCTQLLADLGATVWKIESFQGDDTRRWGPPFVEGESAYYLSVNRNKQSVALNLKDARAQALVHKLVTQADVVVENFKVNDLKRYQLDFASLSRLKPDLIYASITGFGQTGPRAQQPGYDAALQALSGLMSMTGEPERPPVKVGVAVIDVLTGLHTAVAILAALQKRKRTKQAQYLDIALFDVALASLVNQAQATLLTDQAPQKLGSAHPQIVPYQTFETQDGWLSVAVGNDEQYKKFCYAINTPDLWQDKRFQSNTGRVKHRGEVTGRIADTLRHHSRTQLLELLQNAGVPCAPVNTLPEALRDPQVQARGLIEHLTHARIGTLPMVASPFKNSLSEDQQNQAPPLLGEHTHDLLRDVIGLSKEEITELELAGVVLGA